MKKFFSLAALLGAFAIAPVAANASATVWMELVDGSQSAGVSAGLDANNVLQIEKPETGISTFTLALMADLALPPSSFGETTLRSYGLNFSTDSAALDITGGANVPVPGGSASPFNSEPGGGLVGADFSGLAFQGGFGNNQTVMLGTIDISVDKGLGNGPITLTGIVNGATWSTSDFLNAVVNPLVIGDTTTLGSAIGSSGTLVNITNIPEPATLSLLGLGAVALIRRRR